MAGTPEDTKNEAPVPKVRINPSVPTVQQLEKAGILEGQEVIIQTGSGKRNVVVVSYKSKSHQGGNFRPNP